NPEFSDAYKNTPDVKRLIDAARKLEGVARHASVHACGVVIASDPLSDNLPLQYATRGKGEAEQIVVTQFEMHAIEDLGFLKMDFLGLKNLSIIEGTLNIIRSRTGQNINIDEIPLDDESVFNTLAEGKTVGIFQLEGGGMTRYLVELKPARLEDIIAMVALFRPGPMELIPRYIARKHGREPITYLHPKLKPILEPTYGVITYQEQLMQIMQELAGFSFGGADLVRRAVGKKIKQLLDEQIEKFVAGVEKTLGSRELGEKLWKFVEPFARYGFNKAHSAGYALISYQTAYLKTHFPLEFMTALMNSDEKDTDRISFLVSECSKWAIKVLPPDINQSEAGFSPYVDESGNGVIRFGLRTVKNVGANVVDALISERKRNGPYRTLAELLRRLPTKDLNKKSIESLVKCGALDSFGERNQMLKNMDGILGFHKESARGLNQGQNSLFGSPADKMMTPSLQLKEASPASFDERIRWEKELLGLYVSGHPLDKFRKLLESKNTNIASIKKHPENAPVILGGVIESMRKILTKKGDPMVFVKLLDLSDSIEVVMFPRTLKTYSHLLSEDAGIALKGSISHRNGQVSIIADAIKKLEPDK
ncbi:MAG: DNA polymerase III subunit alpha, partial [Patescibacteria group bacterium]